MVRRTAAVLTFCLLALLAPVLSAQAAAPTISAPAAVAKGSTVAIRGTVGPNQHVDIYFHKAGELGYTVRRSLQAGASGAYATSYVASEDQRFYARSEGLNSPILLVQITSLTISAPLNANQGTTVRITGVVKPAGAIVNIYFHRSTDPVNKYTLRRTLRSTSAGSYTTTFTLDTAYRFYATSNGLKSANILTRPSPTWLRAVNAYRAAYGVPAVYENDTLSAADALHARYMAYMGTVGHSESPSSPYYTARGNTAAGRSNVAGVWPPIDSHGGKYWIDTWTTAVFHEIGVLRPTLYRTGFGERSSPSGSAAALDVLSEATRPDPGGWPKTFPSARSPFPFTTYPGYEFPDPIIGCPGAFPDAPVSAPLIVSLGPNAAPIKSATARLVDRSTGTALSTCVLTESTFREPNPGNQYSGRAILAESHTVAVFASKPLSHKHAYSFSVTPNGRAAITVNFSTS